MVAVRIAFVDDHEFNLSWSGGVVYGLIFIDYHLALGAQEGSQEFSREEEKNTCMNEQDSNCSWPEFEPIELGDQEVRYQQGSQGEAARQGKWHPEVANSEVDESHP